MVEAARQLMGEQPEFVQDRISFAELEAREPDYDHAIYEIDSKLPFEGNDGPIKLVRAN